MLRLAAIVAIAGTPPVFAQESAETPEFEEFGVFFVKPDEPDAIYLNGPLDDAALLDFRRASREYPDARMLVLNSPGGSLRTSLAIADEAFEAGFSTVIPSWARCYSACAFLFLAGVDRIAVGELGVHQFSSNNPNLEDAQRVMADVFELLGRFETPQNVISIMLRTPPDDMYVFTEEEVAELGINRGTDIELAAYEAAADILPVFTPLPEATATATLYLDPDDENNAVEGTVTWRVGEDEGEVLAYARIEIEGGVAADLVIAGPRESEGIGSLFMGLWAEAAILSGEEGREVAGVWVTPRGSNLFNPTSFVQFEYDPEEQRHTLASLRRWIDRDLSLLDRAETIELLISGGRHDDVILSLGVDDEVAALLATALEEWRAISADYALGDDTDLEVARTAFLYLDEDSPAIEAEAVWYRSYDEIAFRLVSEDPALEIDIAFGRDEINLVLYPTHVFADGLSAIRAISIDRDLRWTEDGPGIYSATLGTADPRRMHALLSQPVGIELLLQFADGEFVQVFVDKGASFDQLLANVSEEWNNQPAAAAAAPQQAPTPAPAPAPQAQPPAGQVVQAPPLPATNVPDWSLSPTYGTVRLVSGFLPDPHTVPVVSGGNIDARSALGGNCLGFVAEAPDYRLHFEAGQYALFISVLSEADTTLVVNDPNGNWYCDDDGNGYPNPALWWNNPISGQYDIWIGTYANATYHDATLYISEIGAGPAPGGAQPTPPAQQVQQPQTQDNDLQVVATFRDWEVIVSGDTCYAVTSATSSSPQDNRHQASFMWVDVNLSDGSLRPGIRFDYALDETFYVSVYVDRVDRPYDFIPEERGDEAVLYGRAEQADLAAAMRRGIQLEALSVTANGAERTDVFSLLGYTAAVNRARAECG